MKEPDPIEVNPEEFDDLVERIESNTLSKGDQDLLVKVLKFNLWLQHSLSEAKISIKRLSSLFGVSLSKRRRRSPKKQSNPSGESDEEAHGDPSPPKASHGRNSHHAYMGADTLKLKHPDLQPNDLCPLNCGGRLYEIDPGVVIRVTGNSIATATRYLQQKLRCSLCGERFTTGLPDGVSAEDRYDEKVKAVLALQKYFPGTPFHRMETFQNMMGIPLSDSVQWDLVEQVADCVYPVYRAMIIEAAQGKVIHNDDTSAKILSLMKENQEDPDIPRKGIYTTGIVSLNQHCQIVLFFSGRSHAGNNLDQVLKHRSQELSQVIQMSDALYASRTKEAETIQCYCMAHAFRKFVEIQEVWPDECQYVMRAIGKVYEVEQTSRKKGLSDLERLHLHQTRSTPVLDELKTWLDAQLEDNIVEPDNSLGKAIQYCRNHWDKLTRFLEIAGAPIDNNLNERVLKVPIRNRKNALFYKTQHGALVGDIMMSLIYTCWINDINPLEFLIQIQRNRSQVLQNPEQWLPWSAPLEKAA